MYNSRNNRHYETSALPTLVADFAERFPCQAENDVRRFLYAEICANWRLATDVRFKLLALVPVVSAAILISLLGRPNDADTGLGPVTQTVIVLFGFIVTVALWIYDRRNNELYNDLVSRGRKIEQELGIDTGIFLGRLHPSTRVIPGIAILVGHSLGTSLIYGAAMAAWIVAVPIIWLDL